MIFDGINLLDAAVFTNLNVQRNTTLPASGNVGELFYLESPDIDVSGLYIFDSIWRKVTPKQFELTAGNGLSYDETTKVISSKIPETGITEQFLVYRNDEATWTYISKNDVGLGNVDNTSDIDKPISAAIQAVLDTKVNSNNPVFTGTIDGATKGNVGLGNVDNTSDIDKPISDLTQAALDLTEKIANKNVAYGYVGLNGSGIVDNMYLPLSVRTIALNTSSGIVGNITGTDNQIIYLSLDNIVVDSVKTPIINDDALI